MKERTTNAFRSAATPAGHYRRRLARPWAANETATPDVVAFVIVIVPPVADDAPLDVGEVPVLAEVQAVAELQVVVVIELPSWSPSASDRVGWQTLGGPAP